MAVAMEPRGTEVEAKAKRRRFGAEYKRRIAARGRGVRGGGGAHLGVTDAP